jgi:hypothetical protein
VLSHLSFGVKDLARSALDRFHAAALSAGGTDRGAPGLRPHGGETCDAALVLDPDGQRLEAVHP